MLELYLDEAAFCQNDQAFHTLLPGEGSDCYSLAQREFEEPHND